MLAVDFDEDEHPPTITDVKSEVNSRCIQCISVHPFVVETVISYDAQSIRENLEKEVHPDYEGMRVLHLVTDAELEGIASREIVNTRAAKKEFNRNARRILELATAELNKEVRATEERERKIEQLLAMINSRSQYHEGGLESSDQRYSRMYHAIEDLYQWHENPTPQEIASRILGEIRRISGDLLQQAKNGVVSRKTLDNLLNWAATDITKED